jgi:predicted DNA-binding transcriptional regulator YafY
MDGEKTDKVFRLLQMHERLSKGEPIVKGSALAEFGVPDKTFQRDIDSLRLYYAEHGGGDLVYDRKSNRYRLSAPPDKLTKREVFAVCKVLIESRAFNQQEFNSIITKLLQQCEAAEGKAVKSLIANEQVMVGDMADGSKPFPTVFRVDRMSRVERQSERFSVAYSERFSEAEYRKRVQFMYAGELRIVRFHYRGNLEAVLDRLPTAQIEQHTDDGAIIRAEAFGSGIDMWLRSQGDRVEVLE